ncbi:hypothetical protein PN466_14270 [Roseofilum reptotaenium CS-1145]|uniref:Uncharacterized protein n=2 Tax=Roseofilum TaxID=1233426 RepID=A0A1L9QVW0_9CYAN|nr:hypothetical protein [Roseofilum sp. Guam]MBP0028652.1 hypothetical protein [Roseofilum sp. Guam]MDB9518113.1 hypothetical protein [Roseofilum reptotaenium CS-1145]OJJ26810.1 hypothetical protein BI308_03700 [Roseofilum reptotaenium AO1-A]
MLASEPTPQRPPHSVNPLDRRRMRNQRQRSRRRSSPLAAAIAWETMMKLSVNLVLVVVATGAVMRLIPYHRSVEEKLEIVEIQVQQTQDRVTQLQQDFDRSFDPEQAKQVMAEQSHRIDPQRRSVVWKKERVDR